MGRRWGRGGGARCEREEGRGSPAWRRSWIGRLAVGEVPGGESELGREAGRQVEVGREARSERRAAHLLLTHPTARAAGPTATTYGSNTLGRHRRWGHELAGAAAAVAAAAGVARAWRAVHGLRHQLVRQVAFGRLIVRSLGGVSIISAGLLRGRPNQWATRHAHRSRLGGSALRREAARAGGARRACRGRRAHSD